MTAIESYPAVRTNRLVSLDALRGFDMFWIVCGEGIFHGIAQAIKAKHSLLQDAVSWQIAITSNLSFLEKCFISISNQLHHAVWHGFTFYDLIFPLFIFIAGISVPFSYERQLEKAAGDRAITSKRILQGLIRRTIVLIFLGVVVNGGLQLKGYEQTRFASVLGRIAVSGFFATLIYLYYSHKAQIIWLFSLLVGYWLLMITIPVPGYGAGVLSPAGNLAAYIDRLLLPGKLHRGVYDPEGLLSTLPAVGTALLGIVTGTYVKTTAQTSLQKAVKLLIAAFVLVVAGCLWGLIFPVNKNIWSSSFVLLTGGLSLLLFVLFYWLIDIKGYSNWAKPFVWMGVNAILIYMAAHGLIDFEYSARFLFGGIISLMPEAYNMALIWTGVAIIQFIVLFYLDQKKIYLKV
ncbi:MAG: hypothetical protein RLZZ316_970 [Bacteroidota bacterium]|jgi:predicted acyltransferase